MNPNQNQEYGGLKEAEYRKIGDEMDQTIHTAAEKISAEAIKQHGAQVEALSWDEFSVGELLPHKPMSLEDLKTDYPVLVEMLKTPVGQVQSRHDVIDNQTELVAVGYWRNGGNEYSAFRFELKGGKYNPADERTISLVGGYFMTREWDKSPWSESHERYSDPNKMAAAVNEASKLINKQLESGQVKATLSTVKKHLN